MVLQKGLLLTYTRLGLFCKLLGLGEHVAYGSREFIYVYSKICSHLFFERMQSTFADWVLESGLTWPRWSFWGCYDIDGAQVHLSEDGRVIRIIRDLYV